jgi:hypothetical protein
MDGPARPPWSGVPPETELGTTVELVLPHLACLPASPAAASGRTGCRSHWMKPADGYRSRKNVAGTKSHFSSNEHTGFM